MNLEEIMLAFRMIAMGRPNQEAAQALAEALARVLADPEERLAQTVMDEQPAVSAAVAPVDVPAPAKRRGRPPKAK